jgi:hypothetical protein
MALSRYPSIFAAAICLVAANARADNPPIATPYIPTFQDTSTLGSNVVTDTWTNFSSTNDPGYPGISGSQTWPAPLGPDTASGRRSFFQKTPGFDSDYSDFLDASEGGGIYSFFSNTHFEITSGFPVSDAHTIQLQVSMAEGATPADIVDRPILTLSTTNGTFTLAPTSSSLLEQTPVTITAFGDTQTTIDLEGYDWDVSAYSGTINDVTIDWQVDMHSITYGVQLAQAVPEPSSVMLVALAGALPLLRMRSRIRRLC